ncbi:hypothetical protein GLOTRDRAFT_121617 [Gloeophyllum trabeum ATCC 11539]|uniref:Methyltransferase domain-containing protein n=1 Tax=Gloeophyllum trabeum (strain ATCC 11539 / FP-39264 / Madison 617) TaxID=670483 RepID=S7Q4N7_GLOTA|nr:uncharacterized protein GLOTRDRAFT_121617 [Gloeophyllum trabeum ATCC 11539]EPQ54467.1 hypothetical protein GLOTRDRAFT_121617 [Gloeophyllum trabeum ATCC 11539]
MLNPYPTRLRSQSTPARPRLARADSDRPAAPKQAPASPSVPVPAPSPPKPKSRPLTLFAPGAAQLVRKLTPRRKKSLHPSPDIPPPAEDAVPPPPARPPRNPARPGPVKRPSTSSGVPRSPALFPTLRPSTSSGEKRTIIVGDAISPSGGAITPFASFSDLRTTVHLKRRSSTAKKARAPELDVKGRTSGNETRSRSSNATSSISEHSNKDFNLSTPDRAILQELKRSIAARDAQFVTRGGEKHHPYPAKEVPYPRSYERQVVDFDVWEGQFVQQVCGSVTWHVFDTPPTKVLDLGCGTGTWVLECAKTWKKCHFVGLDVVPLHPDLPQVGSSDLASRITWVQANFLEGLPFPNEEFDFVHVKRIARGVPEDKWDSLFEEISRVMKPGAAFEMIEEDLYFPGAARDTSISKLPTPAAQTVPLSPHEQISAEGTARHMYPPPSSGGGVPFDTGSSSNVSGEAGPSSPAFQSEAPPQSPSGDERPTLIVPRPRATSFAEAPEPQSVSDLVRTSPKAPVNPRDHSLLEKIYTEMHSSRFINLAPLSLLGNYLSSYFKNIRTHPPIIITFPPPVGALEQEGLARPRAYHDDEYSSSASSSDWDDDGYVLDKIDRRALKTALSGNRRRKSRKAPSANRLSTYLSSEELDRRTQPYVNVDSARRIALAPSTRASILVSDDPEHPSVFSAPPPSAFHPPGPEQYDADSTPSDSAIDLSSTLGVEFAFDSPSISPSQSHSHLRRRSQLPNKTFNFDLQSLNLHLAARVAEIVACSESMWSWLVEYQESSRDSTVRQGKSASDDDIKQALLSLTRSEFDNLINQFELDMSDYTMLGSLLQQRCDWRMPSIQRTQVRKAFDMACKTWDEHWKARNLRERVHSSAHPPPSSFPEKLNGASGDIRRSKSDASRRRRPSNAHGTVPPERPSPAQGSQGPFFIGDDPSQRLSRTLRVFVAWKP